LPPKPRWTVPLNFRTQDGDLLARALEIAKREQSTLTEVLRIALRRYVSSIGATPAEGILKLDSFVEVSKTAPFEEKLLTREDVRGFTDEELLCLARQSRARKQSLEMELRRRKFFFQW